tara:strand:+ start:1037 stop:1750 length:714 start_codon:yes stop_codon:yes gene_type:complete
MELIFQLKELQIIDSNLEEIRSYLGDLPVKLDELKSREKQLSDNLKKDKDRFKRIEIELNKAEVEIAASRTKIDSLKDQLFKVANNRQYDALMSEIDHLKNLIDDMETKDLELMEEKSHLKEKVNSDQENLKVLTSDLKSKRKILEETMAKSGDKKNILEKERLEKRKNISKGILSTYDRILGAKSGLAVVALEGKACAGCGSAIPPQIVTNVKMNNSLLNCDVCGRFLFWEVKKSE